MTISELHALYVSGTLTPLQVVEDIISALSADEHNILEQTLFAEARAVAKQLRTVEEDNLLWGIPFLVKDNIAIANTVTTGSSKILENYVSPFDAEVITRLKQLKAIPIAKTTLDELGMGGRGTTGHKGITSNPYDLPKRRVVGGSSSGSASGVASGYVPFALGSDTGDSIRKPASYAGIVGFKPTWGAVSRYGLFSFMPTFDHIGFFTRTVLDAALLLDVTNGKDQKDATSRDQHTQSYTATLMSPVKGQKVAILKPLWALYKDKTLITQFTKLTEALKAEGVEVHYVDFDEKLLAAIYPTYLILSCAEATSSNAALTGIAFGKREGGQSFAEIVTKTRSENIGTQAKIRFLIGEYVLQKENYEAYYKNAQRARRLIVENINKIFGDYDFILAPAAPNTAPFFSEENEPNSEIIHNHLAISNFGGFPSLTLPLALSNGLPLGVNLIAKTEDDARLLNIAWHIEQITGMYNLHVGWDK